MKSAHKLIQEAIPKKSFLGFEWGAAYFVYSFSLKPKNSGSSQIVFQRERER
jgi:hypothetical protein